MYVTIYSLYLRSIPFILCYLFLYSVFTDLIRSFTISTLQLTMDSSLMSPQLSSACNHYKYDRKQNINYIFSRHDKSVLGDIDPDTHF